MVQVSAGYDVHIAHESVDRRGDRRSQRHQAARVDPSRKVDPEWDVADELLLDGLAEEAANLAGRILGPTNRAVGSTVSSPKP